MTLNYMSSVWMALFLIGGAVMRRRARASTAALVATVLVGFAGVALVLRPTIEQHQLWHGLIGLLSGMLAAMAYLQVTALGRAGEPEYRVVFYFSLGGVAAGAADDAAGRGCQRAHAGAASLLLLAVGLLATVAQMMMTRAYAHRPHAGQREPAVPGHRVLVRYGVLLFDDP